MKDITLTVEYPSISIAEMREKYKNLVYPNSWYAGEEFVTEKPAAGTYELRIPADSYSKTFDDQMKLADSEEAAAHPAVLMYALVDHFEKTGVRLLETEWARTSRRDSDGSLVGVGSFDSEGMEVRRDRPDYSSDLLGVCFSRMNIEPLNSEIVNEAEAFSRSDFEKVSTTYKHKKTGIETTIRNGKFSIKVNNVFGKELMKSEVATIAETIGKIAGL